MANIAQPLARHHAFGLYDRDQKRIDRLDLSNLDCSDAKAVQRARAEITNINWVERFVDWAFCGSHRWQALQAIATVALCGRAREWALGKPWPTPVEGLDETDRRAAQCRLVSMLSAEGMKQIEQTYEVRETGVTFRLFADARPNDPINQTMLEFAMPRTDVFALSEDDVKGRLNFLAFQDGVASLAECKRDDRDAVVSECCLLLQTILADHELSRPVLAALALVLQKMDAKENPEDWQRLLVAALPHITKGLRRAIANGRTADVESFIPLLEAMPQPDQIRLLGARVNDGGTGLMAAMQNGHTAVIEALIPLVKAMPQRDQIRLLGAAMNNGTTGLMKAMQNGHTAVIEALIPLVRALPQPDQIRLLGAATEDGITGLMAAMNGGHSAVIEVLIPLMQAMPQPDRIRLLAAAASNGLTGLMQATRRGHAAVIEVIIPLLERMAQADQIRLLEPSAFGATALSMAIKKGHTQIIRAFVPMLKEMTPAQRHLVGIDDESILSNLTSRPTIIRINEAISRNLFALSSSGLVTGTHKIVMDEGRDIVSLEQFEPGTSTEWCLLRRDENIFDVYTAHTVDRLMCTTKQNPVTRVPLKEKDVVRGEAVLTYLQ